MKASAIRLTAMAATLAMGGVLSVTLPTTAWAQAMAPGNGGATGRMATGPGGKDKQVLPDPDAVPGAKARAPAAPATRAATDMQPTDALFDAINRGDIAAARDAVNRGADMHGVNVLGMTPMELSVDLGRNDISFMLLSMRGEDSDRGARAVSHEADTKPAMPRAAQARKPVKTVAAKEAPVAVKPVAAPKLFANDGGTPLPNAGFMGFDSRSATN